MDCAEFPWRELLLLNFFSSAIEMHVIKISPSCQRPLQERELWDDFTHPSPALLFHIKKRGKEHFYFHNTIYFGYQSDQQHLLCLKETK